MGIPTQPFRALMGSWQGLNMLQRKEVRTAGPKGLNSPDFCGTAEAVPFVQRSFPGLRGPRRLKALRALKAHTFTQTAHKALKAHTFTGSSGAKAQFSFLLYGPTEVVP
jgi:hypothetical protein